MRKITENSEEENSEESSRDSYMVKTYETWEVNVSLDLNEEENWSWSWLASSKMFTFLLVLFTYFIKENHNFKQTISQKLQF